ncbi:MAG TPA: aminoglycoside phosphotransferase family protein [Caulobacteraceae bacterium]|jgi:aminoglycoside phosphotransferase (APT) family kinase protein
MPPETSFAGEIDAALVSRLIASQFPHWADLPVTPVPSQGWDNRTFRLGETMSVRLPSARRYVASVEKEQRWLPRLAPHLPLPIPAPLAVGAPGEDYPFPWSVGGWLEGEAALTAPIADKGRFAADLADFLAALHRIDPDGPATGAHSFWRGGPLSTYDGETRRAIAVLGGQIDAASTTKVWDAALAAALQGQPVWVHGDIAPSNLLARDGRLSAVIDFGQTCVGDPACDLAIAWTFFNAEARAAFRAGLPLDAGTWARGRGWALWKALIILAGLSSNQAGVHLQQGIVGEIIADYRDSQRL